MVAGGDPAPVFEAGEHVLDLVALSIEVGVMGDGDLPAFAGGAPQSGNRTHGRSGGRRRG